MSIRRQRRMRTEFIDQRAQLPGFRRVRRRPKCIQNGVHRLVNGLGRTRRRRLPARRTEFMMRRQRRRTIPTRLPDGVRTLFGVKQASRPEDILVMLGRRDVLVGLPHVGVERPVHAMLDLRARVPLPDHPRDRGVPERMRVRRLLHTAAVRDPAELLSHRVRRHPTIVTPPLAPIPGRRLQLVEQRDIRVVRPGVGATEVRPNRRRRIDQRIARDRGALQPERVSVRRVRRRVLEVDVADPKRQRHRQPTPGVGEELDERDVALMPRRRDELVDVLLVEDVVLRGPISVHRRPVDLLRPLRVRHLTDKRQNRVLVTLHRRILQTVVVPERKDEVVPTVLVKLDERHTGALTPETTAPQVDLDTGDFQAAIQPAEVATDGVPIIVVDLCRVGEAVTLVLEAAGEVLGVVERHTPSQTGGYYKLTTRESTSTISSEAPKPGDAVAASQGVAA